MISESGVYYGDLKESPFTVEVSDYVFYFSQASKANNFIKQLSVKIPWLNDSLCNRFKMKFDADELAIFNTYSKIETRGYCYCIDDQYFYNPPIVKTIIIPYEDEIK